MIWNLWNCIARMFVVLNVHFSWLKIFWINFSFSGAEGKKFETVNMLIYGAENWSTLLNLFKFWYTSHFLLWVKKQSSQHSQFLKNFTQLWTQSTIYIAMNCFGKSHWLNVYVFFCVIKNDECVNFSVKFPFYIILASKKDLYAAC